MPDDSLTPPPPHGSVTLHPDIGTEPGLRFAFLFDAKGGATALDWAGVGRWQPADGFLWVHLERDDATAQAWMREKSGLDPLATLTLLAEESRPRVTEVESTLIVVLRGVNVGEGGDGVDLVPVHIAADAGRLVSLRDSDHHLTALRDLRGALMKGRGPRNGAELIALIAERVVDHVEDVLETLEEQISQLETLSFSSRDVADRRADLGEIRLKATTLRRYIAPQRDALYRLQHEDAGWMTKRAKLRLREVADKITRNLEDLEALRDRAIILHEDMTAKVSEEIARNGNRFTALAALVLPPSLLASLLGINVDGIPGKDDPNAFLIVCLLIVAMMPGLWFLLKKLKWV